MTTNAPGAPFPNYFRDQAPWLDIKFGGRLMRAALVEVDGISTEDEWKKQKSKEKSGSTNVFSGTKAGEPKLTFEAFDEADFDDLRALWELLKPVPGLGGSTGTGAAAKVPTGYAAGGAVGSPPAASGASAPAATGAGAGFATAGVSGGTTTTTAAKTSEPDPGPKPPTIPVEYLPLLWHGFTAVARKKWEGPKFTETGSIRHVLTFIIDDPPKPAGAGAQAPVKDIGSQYATAGVTPAGGGAAAPPASSSADAKSGASGT